MTECARREPEVPEIIPPWPPAPDPAPALDVAPEPSLQYLPRRIIPPQPPASERASEAAPRPSSLQDFPRRGFGIGSVVAIVLGVAVWVIASIVWFKPFAASTLAKPRGYETIATPSS